jgi:3,4-dihydroxy 2-butanone 4-phosphate synthase/GTP cyclohydrolase II
MSIERVEKAIEEIKKGNMVIMMDDEDRENEGDLVYAATFSTPEKVNFMATHAKGLICTALTTDIAERLNLQPMVSHNDSSYETAFTVSVDAKEAATGISAHERDMTIKILADHVSGADDLVRPGHIFPLIAKDGGVLVRTGHTEGSVDLCHMAGVAPVGVICEIIKEDGTMARRDDLEIFAKEHDMHIVFISDMVQYRLQQESLIKVSTQARSKILGTEVKEITILDHHENIHTAYIFGKVSKHTNVRFHNIAPDIELFTRKKRLDSLVNSIDYLKEHDGVLVFIQDDDSMGHDAMKDYGIGAQILKSLGVESINLLVSSKGKEFIGISGFGLHVASEVTIV